MTAPPDAPAPATASRPSHDRLARFAHHVWASKGWISLLLLPLSWLTGIAVALKRLRYRLRPSAAYRSRLPVAVVGNLFVGGTGKTPVVIAVVKALQARGWKPGVISRGYGVPSSDSPRHGQGHLTPSRFGDEPTLIAAETGVPIVVHPARAQAAQCLEEQYPYVDVIVTDDGLQHLALARDVEIVVQDSRGCGNGRLLPAGPLREPASRLAQVDFLVTQLDAAARQPVLPESQDETPPIRVGMTLAPGTMRHLLSGRTLPFADWLTRDGATPVSAVAAIGNPQRFFQMLRHAGLQLEQTIALPDHDSFRHPPFALLPAGPILLTPKDAVKCADLQDERLWVVEPQTHFTNNLWLDILDGRLRHAQWGRNPIHQDKTTAPTGTIHDD